MLLPRIATLITGLSLGAMAHAMEKALAGQVDPRDVEARFMAFETLLLRQGRLPADGDAIRRAGAPR